LAKFAAQVFQTLDISGGASVARNAINRAIFEREERAKTLPTEKSATLFAADFINHVFYPSSSTPIKNRPLKSQEKRS
jgi:hypothetical protein